MDWSKLTTSLTPLRAREFRLLFTAQTASVVGDNFTTVALGSLRPQTHWSSPSQSDGTALNRPSPCPEAASGGRPMDGFCRVGGAFNRFGPREPDQLWAGQRPG